MNAEIGIRTLREVRKSKGLKMIVIAYQLDMSEQFVRRVENGYVPPFRRWGEICQAYGIELPEFKQIMGIKV